MQISAKIIWQCHNFKKILNDDYQHHSFLSQAKSFVNIIFYGAENNKLRRGDNQPFKHLFTIWFTLAAEKYFLKLCNVFYLKLGVH